MTAVIPKSGAFRHLARAPNTTAGDPGLTPACISKHFQTLKIRTLAKPCNPATRKSKSQKKQSYELGLSE